MTTTWDYLVGRDPDLEQAREAMFDPPHIGVPRLKEIAHRRHARQEAEGHHTAADKIEGYYGPDPSPSNYDSGRSYRDELSLGASHWECFRGRPWNRE